MSDHNAARQAREAVATKAETIHDMQGDPKLPVPLKGKKVAKEESVLDKIDSLAKSLEGEEEAPVAVVEEAVVEEAAVEVTPEVAPVVEEVAPVTKDAEPEVAEEVKEEEVKEEDTTKAKGEGEKKEKCNDGMKKSTADVAVEKLTAFLTDSLVPMIKSLQKSFADLSDTVAKSQNIEKSFHEDKFATLTKSQEDLNSTVLKMA